MFKETLVTVVIVQRERFSSTRRSLEMLFRNSVIPFKLVYVDCGSPGKHRRYLQQQAKKKEFTLLRTNFFCPPNVARNKGLEQVKTKYVVLLDNDVMVGRGWLRPLIECAEETGASIVTPLICQTKIKDRTRMNIKKVVHCAGGEIKLVKRQNNGQTERHIVKKRYGGGQNPRKLCSTMKRQETGMAEFHCILIRMDVFERIGVLDEQMFAEEFVDFCLGVKQSGGRIYLEPESVVTYVPGPLRDFSDIRFYMLRWSDKWETASYERIKAKWDVSNCPYFAERWPKIGWRRRQKIAGMLSRVLVSHRWSGVAEKVLIRLDNWINPFVTECYHWRYRHSLPRVRVDS